MGNISTFVATERSRAAAWKQATTALSDAAKAPAPYVDRDGLERGPDYEFCLPSAFASESLLPEVRAQALALFSELDIPWHPAGISPSNHLLSSQVQCVNALTQMVTDPTRIIRAFGPILDTAEVLEIEAGRFLTFEYIGERDYFGEAPGGQRVRGAMCTSVDAAFLHRTTAGVVELVLVEWKYIESYTPRDETSKIPTRRKRYEPALRASNGPVRAEVLDFEDLLDEPLYQLMRQQLLAHELERDRAHGAEVVRVVHVHPTANVGYQQSLKRPSQLAVGSTVSEVWSKLLRRSDRFTSVDNALFLDPSITSAEYVRRYGGPDPTWSPG
jgi:hypothetical protein